MRIDRSFLPACFAFVSLAAGASAQQHSVLWWKVGPGSPNAGMGKAVVAIGDVDGDGRDDVAVDSPYLATPGGSGAIDLFSGATGASIGQLTAVGPDAFGFGQRFAVAGDVDADGFIDLIAQSTHSNNAHEIWIVSLAGGVLRNHSGGDAFGLQVAGGGDVNADGRDDYLIGNIVGPQGQFNVAGMEVRSGATGAIVWTQGFGDQTNGNPLDGWPVLGPGDLDGDGFAEFAMGFTGQVTGLIGGGMVRVWSGKTGLLKKQLTETIPALDFGANLVNVGDIDHDNVNDIGIGEPNGSLNAKGTIVSGKTLTTLFTVQKTDAIVGPAGDADGDGYLDVVVTPESPSANPSAIISGFDHATTLYTFTHTTFIGAWGMDALGDVDGDGFGDLAVGGPGSQPGGRVDVISGCPSSAIPIPSSCAGSGGFIPQFKETGCFQNGGTVSLALTQGLGGAPAILFVGTVAGGGFVSPGCFFLCGPPALPAITTVLSSAGAGQGAWSATFGLSNLTPAAFRVQFAIADPGKPAGIALSNAITITVASY